MTDTQNKNEPKEPPRINIGALSEDESGKQDPVATPPVNQGKTPPPKLKIRSGTQQDSSPQKGDAPAADKPKIKLNLVNDSAPPKAKPKPGDTGKVPPLDKMEEPAETPPDPVEKPKIKLNLDAVAEVKSETEKTAETQPESATKPEPPKSEEPDLPPPAKAETPKITLNQPPAESAEQDKPTPDAPPAEAEAKEPVADLEVIEEKDTESKKSQTIRLDDLKEESLDDLYKAALNATQRVILDEKQKAATGKIAAEKADELLDKAALTESSKKSTARLDLQEMLSDSDQKELLKKQTMAISPEDTPQKPGGTVKIKRPDAVSQPPDSTIAIDTDLEQSKKSETARIDLPRDVAGSAPPTQRKTIRIKRPDGAGGAGRTLTVARSGTGESGAATPSSPKKAVKVDSDEVSIHTIFAIAAVLAVLVAIGVVYVLAATLSPDLPFPGRLV